MIYVIPLPRSIPTYSPCYAEDGAASKVYPTSTPSTHEFVKQECPPISLKVPRTITGRLLREALNIKCPSTTCKAALLG